MISRLRGQHGSGLRETNTYLGQKYIVADSSLIPELLQVLRDQEQFDYCVDITAVHYPDREKQFEVVWILYSFPHNERIRVKASYADDGVRAQRRSHLAGRQLAGARSLRHVRHPLRRTS